MSETEPIVKWLSPLSAEWVCPLPRSGSALSPQSGSALSQEVGQPSPEGRGWTATALSPAVAGRVRGLLHGFANKPLPYRLARPPPCRAAQAAFLGLRLFRNPVLQGRRVANLSLQPPVAPRGRFRALSLGWVARQGQRETIGDARLRWSANGRNPSPVRRRLEKAPSPDTLSPRERVDALCRERAMFPTWAPAVSSQRCGTPVQRKSRRFSGKRESALPASAVW
jgi:hypothetical protein